MVEDIYEELKKSVELQSLEKLAAVRTAISVCESKDVQCMIGNFCKSEKGYVGFSDYQWKRLCNKVKRNLGQDGVPEIIIDIILENLWPISFEIYNWIIFHSTATWIESSPNFFWTPHASIDYEKTAKIITENEALDIGKRFRMACIYCFEQDVRSLWEKMTLREKRFFFSRRSFKLSYLNPIVFYWTYYIQEAPIEYWRSMTLNNTKLFIYAIRNGYLSATKFFLGKFKMHIGYRMILNSFEMYLDELYKSGCLVKPSHFATAYFLIIETCPYLLENICSNMLILILRYFLEWPLQKHFMTVFDRSKNNILETSFGDLMTAIFEKYLADFKDYDYKKLFIELWNLIPSRYRTYINTDSRVGVTMLFKFVKTRFRFVLEQQSFGLKRRFREIVLEREISEDTYYEKEDVEFFKFLVRERVTTKSSIESFGFCRFLKLFYYREPWMKFCDSTFGELLFLIDGILRASPNLQQIPQNFEQ